MSNLKFNLRTVRSQLETYKEHTWESIRRPPPARTSQNQTDAEDRSEHDPRRDQRNLRSLYRGRAFRSTHSKTAIRWSFFRATRNRRPRPAAPTAGSTIRPTAGSIRTTSNTSRARQFSRIRTDGCPGTHPRPPARARPTDRFSHSPQANPCQAIFFCSRRSGQCRLSHCCGPKKSAYTGSSVLRRGGIGRFRPETNACRRQVSSNWRTATSKATIIYESTLPGGVMVTQGFLVPSFLVRVQAG